MRFEKITLFLVLGIISYSSAEAATEGKKILEGQNLTLPSAMPIQEEKDRVKLIADGDDVPCSSPGICRRTCLANEEADADGYSDCSNNKPPHPGWKCCTPK